MPFDLNDLRLFLAVVDAGSITHGAQEVGLSLPAASERLRAMEAAGDVTLLTRGRRGVSPTEAGEALVHHARMIIRQTVQMRSELGAHARGVRATVRVLANTAAMTEYIPERLAAWMAANPQIDIELKERQSVEIARSVAAGFTEIGILSDAVEASGLTLHPFATDRLVVVAGRDHPIIERTQVRFADLLDERFIGLAGGALQDHIDSQAAKLGAKLKMRVKLRTFDDICRMAGAGVGVGIVPEKAARRCRRAARISVIHLQETWAVRRLSVCIRSDGQLTPPALSLFGHLTGNRQS
ncbi:LysR family transcriptional regulator [Ensifer sp. SSB1]|jgi:DNA-binding transcriptional LysR family regulator|uniref:LysR family transcriptional regulator n=1 Tax=Ensifer sp. SSB1 TaxID=2795385 RepID=UPI001A55B41F|nr:LysR family transcriptional regulator [Ensifer sp. SSB1]MBK5565124.1 LysR family transcriptional regulator [Ensifer sp. SSB1]